MTDEELIESLRLWNRDDAADRIEALTEQLAAARRDAKEAEAYAEELEKAMKKDWNDGQIHGWNGGDCPVHPKTVVEYWIRDGGPDTITAEWLRWEHTDMDTDIIAFRVVKEYVEPKVIWVNEYEDGEHMAFETEADARARVGNGKTRIAVKYVECKDE